MYIKVNTKDTALSSKRIIIKKRIKNESIIIKYRNKSHLNLIKYSSLFLP